MGLTLPSVGVTIGPTWASQLNTALEDVDAHDHSPGNGVAITPSGLSINATLPFNGNAAGTVGRVELVSQAATTALACNVYVVAGDLWYTNASGTAVQLTIGGSPAAGGGSISGMTGTTASAVYNNGTKAFEWNQASGLRATLDAGAVQLRQAGVSSAASVSLAAPSTGVTSYTLTLPATAPATVGRFLYSLPSGAASWIQPDASTVEVSGTTLQVKALGIGTAQLAASAVTSAKIAAGAVNTSNINYGAVTGGIAGTLPTGSIAYRTIATENIAELAITGAKIDLATITSANLANNAVTLGKIATGAVANTNLVTDAVRTVNIQDLNVTTAKLADLAVTTAKLADLGVTTGKLALLAVGTAQLADLAVTTAKLADASVATAKLIDSSVTPVKRSKVFGYGNYTNQTNLQLSSAWTVLPVTNTLTPDLAGDRPVTITIQGNSGNTQAEFTLENRSGTGATKTFAVRVTLKNGAGTSLRIWNTLLYMKGNVMQSFPSMAFQDVINANESNCYVELALFGNGTDIWLNALSNFYWMIHQ